MSTQNLHTEHKYAEPKDRELAPGDKKPRFRLYLGLIWLYPWWGHYSVIDKWYGSSFQNSFLSMEIVLLFTT